MKTDLNYSLGVSSKCAQLTLMSNLCDPGTHAPEDLCETGCNADKEHNNNKLIFHNITFSYDTNNLESVKCTNLKNS